MWRRIVSSHLKTLAASDFTAASPRRLSICNPVLSASTTNRSTVSASSSSSHFLRHFNSESECRFYQHEHIKTLATTDLAAASPCRFCRLQTRRSSPCCQWIDDLRFFIVFPLPFQLQIRNDLSLRVYIAEGIYVKKNVEDVEHILTGNETKELEKERCLSSGEGNGGIGDGNTSPRAVVVAAAVLAAAVMVMVAAAPIVPIVVMLLPFVGMLLLMVMALIPPLVSMVMAMFASVVLMLVSIMALPIMVVLTPIMTVVEWIFKGV
ncbi:unnamed protein product [Microthlaspi erraticum]|uniref:Uncharacterized protein n=1 Tax=Microthlaspi erraticum TaxID=1685480 RepID=A0A6D2IXE7_9BRAS|nr:unnamed protein product [Microthlaspi erraticum]